MNKLALLPILVCFTLVTCRAASFLELSCSCETPSSCASEGFLNSTIDEMTAIFLLGCEQLNSSNVYELRLSWAIASIDRTFSEFRNLKKFKVAKSSIRTLSQKCFEGLTRLEFIWMDGNEIESLPKFPQLANLAKLFLASNKIEMIQRDTFSQLRLLQSLKLEDNKIFYIHAKAFTENKNLKELNLNRNDLRFLEPGTFDCNLHLRELTMNYNKLKKIPPNLLEHNKKLEVLQLHSNLLESLDKEIFVHNLNLRWIELSENRLVAIHQAAFRDLKNLEFVNVAFNECIDDSYPVEMNFEHFLKLINRNCHILAGYYFDFLY